MYLSRFEINPARRESRKLLASPQAMHGAVLKAFPAAEREPTDKGRILWRLDQGDHQTLLYVVSPTCPDFTHLVESAGWPSKQDWQWRDYTPLLDRLDVGELWNFRLVANPSHSTRKTSDARRSQRFGHVTVAQQHEWLLSRAEQNGFEIPSGFGDEPDVAVHSRRTWRFHRGEGTVTLNTALFGGSLRVRDPEALRRALVHGIGPAKSYGCGLLTLAPVG